MDSDRRQFSRSEPANLVYARFGKANGGIVLNASLGGLCFQTVAPTQPDNVVELTVSPTAKETIPVTGKIVWTDNGGKMGGLEFVDPAPEVKARLKNWLFPQMSSEKTEAAAMPPDIRPEGPRAVSVFPRSAGPEPTRAPAGVTVPTTAPAAVPAGQSTPMFELPPRYKSYSSVPRMFGSLTGAGVLADSAAFERPRKSSHWFLRTITNLIFFGLLLLLPAAYIYNFYPQFAYSLIDRAIALYSGADSAKPIEPPPTVTPPVAASPELESEKPSNPAKSPGAVVQPEGAAPTIPTEKALPRPEKTVVPPPKTRSPKIQPERLAKSPLVKMPVDPNDPNELWVAVGQGDTEAEVALARLYLTGRLVKKNCEQGRVLLTAASKKGNADAIAELRQLLRRGCR